MTEINPDALRSAIQERIQLAEAATPGPWIHEYSGETGQCVIPADAQSTREFVARTQLYAAYGDAAFIAAHDPSFMLRVYRQWLDVLDRHQPRQRTAPEGFAELALLLHPGPWCSHDQPPGIVTHSARWPCHEVRSVAAALGVPVEEGTTDA